MKKAVIFLFLFMFAAAFAFASDAGPQPEKKSCLKELGILTGYASGGLDEKPHYELVPTIVRLGFDLNPFINKFGWNTKGLLEFQLEPFLNTVVSPNNNIEVGSNFLLKYAFPMTKKFYPYVEGGLGVLYMSQHTREQATQYNFLPQGGAGIMFFLKDDLALTAGYRYRHLSNNSFEHPNSGINVDMYLVGLSFIY